MSQLSIITVNLNNNPGLRRTMESVLHQKYTEYEYVVVDGGSEDGSVQSIREVENSFAGNFHWISEPDSGIYEAMNKGIRMAKGKYLLFLNSGDFLVHENVLKDVFDKNHDADFIIGKCQISKDGKIVHTTVPPDRLTFSFIFSPGIPHQSTFIKKDLFEKFGLYREDFKFNGDCEFWIRTIVLNGCSVETTDLLISDYNMDGLSSRMANSEEFQKEMSIIYAHPTVRLFIPDYEKWQHERREMSIMYWAKSRKPINSLIISLYKVAVMLNKLRRKKCAA